MARTLPPRDSRGRFVKRGHPPDIQGAPIRAIQRSDLQARGRKATLWKRIGMTVMLWFDVACVRGRPSLASLND